MPRTGETVVRDRGRYGLGQAIQSHTQNINRGRKCQLKRRQYGKVYIDYEERKQKADDKAAKIAALEEKIERLKTLYVEGLIDIEEYKHDKALYLGRIADLSTEVDKPPRIDRNALKQLNGADFRDVYASLSREERRRFWRGIIKEIRFGLDKRIEVDFL